jgi:uncharacterized protein (TIGR03382 family)
MNGRRAGFLTAAGLGLVSLAVGLAWAGTSALWGASGEDWDPRGRLPDFSWAGYENGESAIPSLPVLNHVEDFGAFPDDGLDDTWAIQEAILSTENGAVKLDAGVYDISEVIWITESNVAIRGASPWIAGTWLNIDRSMSETELGFSQSWGWAGGGFLFFQGKSPQDVTSVTENAYRGDRTLTVASSADLSEGQHVLLYLEDDWNSTLRKHLHNDLLSTIPCADNPKVLKEQWSFEIDRIEGNLITFTQPLRMDVRPEWSPMIRKERHITNVGVENVRIVFTADPKMAKDPYIDKEDVEFISTSLGNVLLTCPGELPGPVCHHHELGYNGVYFKYVRDGWARDISVVNSDVGIMVSSSSTRVTVEDIHLYGRKGHHGVVFSHADNSILDTLYTSANWIHAVTITHGAAGNVAKKLYSPDHVLHMDHHRDAPFENLICDSPEMDWNYDSGGSTCYGPHSAARETFWGLKGPMGKPSWDHYQMNIVGDLSISEVLTDEGNWFEDVSSLTPADLHQSQLDRRLNLSEPTVFDDDPIYGDRANWLERDPSRWRLDEYGGGKYRYVLHFGDYAILDGNRLGEWSVVPSETYENVSVSCWAKTGESFNTNDYADYALVLAWQDDLNYYAGLFNQVGTYTEIVKVVDGVKTNLSGPGTVAIEDYVYHKVELRKEGDQLTLLYDEVVVAEASDSTFSVGSVGVGSNNDRARFDMFDVSCLPDCGGKVCGDDGCGGSCGACSDGNVCTDDGCESGACVYTPNAQPCEEGDECSVNDACAGGVCVPGGPMDCDDQNPCTDDGCTNGGCYWDENQAGCDDDDPCTVDDQCIQGGCAPGNPMGCDDLNPCTDDACVDGECVHSPNASPCDDGDGCTQIDACSGGICVGSGAPDCADGNACTLDLCSGGACTHPPQAGACDDGDGCTVGDYCADGTCSAGLPMDCDDANPCTLDGCVFGSCLSQPDDLIPCDDGDGCTIGDFCGGASCQAGDPMDCGDAATCESGACVDDEPNADAGSSDADGDTSELPGSTGTDGGFGTQDANDDTEIGPNVTEPNLAEPEVTETDVAEPEVTETDVAEPEVTETEPSADAPTPDDGPVPGPDTPAIPEPDGAAPSDVSSAMDALQDPPVVGTKPSSGSTKSGGCASGTGAPVGVTWAGLALLYLALRRRRVSVGRAA